MMTNVSKFFAVCALLLLSACSTHNLKRSLHWVMPRDVVMAAADAAMYKKGVLANVDMEVKGTGKPASVVYLNSEKDYRDQRCLSIAISPEAQAALTHRYGVAPEVFFLHKRIRVKGPARRVKIRMTEPDGTFHGDYYYQTHLWVNEASQIEVWDADI